MDKEELNSKRKGVIRGSSDIENWNKNKKLNMYLWDSAPKRSLVAFVDRSFNGVVGMEAKLLFEEKKKTT